MDNLQTNTTLVYILLIILRCCEFSYLCYYLLCLGITAVFYYCFVRATDSVVQLRIVIEVKYLLKISVRYTFSFIYIP